MLNELRKCFWKIWIELASINSLSNGREHVGAPTGSIAGWPIDVIRRYPRQYSRSRQKVVNEGVDDNEARAHIKPARPARPSSHQ